MCEHFGATCSFCKQQVPHPSPDQSDWSNKDWDGNKAKARKQKVLVNFDIPKIETKQWTTDLVDTLPISNLTLKMDEQDVKALEVSTTLVPSPEPGVIGTVPKDDSKKLYTIPEEEEEAGLMEHELKLQREEEKYAIYISNLSPEDSTDMETDEGGIFIFQLKQKTFRAIKFNIKETIIKRNIMN